MASELIRIKTSNVETLRELSRRTRIDMTELLDAIFSAVQKQLDLMENGKILSFMADFYTLDNVPKTIIRLSDANSFGIPLELDRKQVLRAFDYEERDGHLIDLREKKEEVKQ